MTVSFKERIDTFHILGYHVVKFDCAVAVVSRYIGVPPSPSELVSVYTSGWGIVNSQAISFFYPRLRKVYVSIYKTSIRVFLHSWLNCQISRRYTRCQVDITVQPSESGLITVYLYIPQTGTPNGVGWLLQKVICPPTCLWHGCIIHILG